MKKTLSRVMAIVLALALVIPSSAIPTKAATWDNVPETHYASRYTSAYYTYGKFYDNMTKIPLTGDGARDVVAIAASQMGYVEGDSSYGHDGVTGGSSNYTEYGAYTAVDAAAWCASFCSWVFYAAEVTDIRGTTSYMARNGYYWSECYVPYWSSFLMDNGRYRYSLSSQYDGYGTYQETYIPQPGDLVFFYTTSGDYPGEEGHIGLVAYCDGSYVYTLEGNTSSQEGVESEGGGAFFKKYAIDSSSLIGYGVMPYETVAGLPEIDYSGENPTPGLYVSTSGAKSIYADIEDSTGSWTLPMSSVFEVLAIDYDSLGNTMLYSKCEIDGATIYGWILHGNGSNGNTRTLQVYASPTEYDDSNDQNHDGIPDSYNHTVGADGTYSFENVNGHEFYINDVNGVIDGEDATLITSATAYASCNPNWAISVQLRPTGNDGEYKVVKVVECPQTSDAAAAGITMEDGDVILVVHSAGSMPGYSNWINKVAALTLEAGDVVNLSSNNKYVTVPSVDDSEDPDPTPDPDPEVPEVEEPIRYQIKDSDVRFTAYVDALEKYSSVAFTLKIGDKVSKPLVCTVAYAGLYASGELKTTTDVYGIDGYFVAYTVNGYLDVYSGQEVTITVTYTSVTGETSTEVRTITIGTLPGEDPTPSEPIETGSLTYANGWDWSDSLFYQNNIIACASTDATATPSSLFGQGAGFFGWWTIMLLEYNATNGTWKVVDVTVGTGTNSAENTTLGANRLVVLFHPEAAIGQPENYEFFTKHAVVGEELYLNGTLSNIQSTTGTLVDVSLATGIEEE